MCEDRQEFVPIFAAVAAVIVALVAVAASLWQVPILETPLWLAAVASLAALGCLGWAARSISRKSARAEQATAALRAKEAALRETENRFRAVCDNARAAFGILDGTRLIYANRYFSELTGYSNEEILSMDFRQMTHPSFHELMLERARKRLAGEPVPSHYEFLSITKNGEERWVDFSPAATELNGKRVIIGTGFDITERKRAEVALRESEEKFRLLAENCEVLICICRDRQVLYANPYLLELSGYTQEELTCLDLAQMIPPEDRDMVLDRARRRQNGEPLDPSYEYKLLDKGGKLHWVELWGVRIEYQGRPAILAAGIDITERKRAEEALRESQERFRIVAENARAAFGIVQGNRFVYANPYLAEISGYTIDEILSMDFVELIRPDQREAVADSARRRQLGEPVPTNYEVALLTKDGQIRWLDMSLGRIEYNGRPAIVGAAYDVTFRKQAEQELRRREEHFRLLAEAMPQMVWIARPDGYLEYFNSRCYEYGGATFDQGKGDDWMRWLHPDDLERTKRRWHHSLTTGEPYEIEYRFRRAHDGTYRWFLGRALPVRDESGQIVSWFGTSTEIHEQKQLQEQLAAAQQAAEHARQVAEDASRAKDRFIAVLSHELRTPLTPVLAAVSLLQRRPELDSQTVKDLEMIRRNVELEARLIDDLLDMTRIARGRIDLDRRRVELDTIIRRAAEVCGPDFKNRDLNFGVDWGSDPPYVVEADVARLQQVFWNLLKNSIKFTPHGGCIGIRCRAEPGHVVVEVNDSGMGIEPEALQHIFDAFSQAPVARQFGGLGLGLAITKSLVELHGGTIEACSEGRGKGATFTVRLPRVDAAVTAAPPPEPPSAQHRGLRMMLVEDHGDTADMMKLVLESEGHQVTLAGDVQTALEKAEQDEFDLLISDLGLPDGTGVDLLRELHARGREMPAIALSGYGREQDVEQSRSAGFAAHLIKPVDTDRLVQVVSQIKR
ncbi:MAG TPA: PAS domain S-box protein [Phycisphaerae bacterium]|mgnify:CR=1 FL=1|nr:PAS domain S-box protein [Phycisphaerae bacterium]